jgi:hypothetical protein
MAEAPFFTEVTPQPYPLHGEKAGKGCEIRSNSMVHEKIANSVKVQGDCSLTTFEVAQSKENMRILTVTSMPTSNLETRVESIEIL